MPSNLVQQITRLTTGKLNTVDDSVAGGIANALTSFPFMGGQLGARVALDHEDAAQLSDTSIGTLYGGLYQYVQTKAGSTAAPARGRIAYWDDVSKYLLTPDAPTAQAEIAGYYISAPTKGNFCIVQIDGLAGVLFGTVTKGTPVIGDLVIGAAGVADVLADATALTSVELRKLIGIAHEAPVSDNVKLVQLTRLFLNV